MNEGNGGDERRADDEREGRMEEVLDEEDWEVDGEENEEEGTGVPAGGRARPGGTRRRGCPLAMRC